MAAIARLRCTTRVVSCDCYFARHVHAISVLAPFLLEASSQLELFYFTMLTSRGTDKCLLPRARWSASNSVLKR